MEKFQITANPAINNSSMRIDLITVFWGEWHEYCFLELALPSLLKQFNLEYLCERAEVRFRIRSTERFIGICKNRSSFQDLEKLVEIDLGRIDLDEGDTDTQLEISKYGKWSYLLSKLLSTSAGEGSSIIFIAPDAVYSGNVLKSIWTGIHEGKKLIWISHLRCSYEAFEVAWFKISEAKKTDAKLLKTTLGTLHNYSKSQFWGRNPMNCRLNTLFFEGKNGALYSKMFDAYPIFVDSEYAGLEIQGAMDTDYDLRVFEEVVRKNGFCGLGIVSDMKEGFLASMVPKEDVWIDDIVKGDVDVLPPLIDSRSGDVRSDNWKRLIHWTACATNSKQKYQFMHTFFYGNPVDEFELEEVELFGNLTLSFANYYEKTSSFPEASIAFDSPIGGKLRVER